MTREALCAAAIEAMGRAYAPYSGYKVGAALLTADGKVYTGCNIENASYTPTVCAERTAIFKAVSEGAQEFEAIAVCGGSADLDVSAELPLTSPCGICRQALYEFGGDELTVLLVQSEDKWTEMKLGELLTLGFGPKNLA